MLKKGVSNMRGNTVLLRFLAILITSQVAFVSAQGVTIGGTESGEDAGGFTSLFTGNRFENFRHLERFVPTSEMSASTKPWHLGESKNSLQYSGMFMGAEQSLEEFIEHSSTSTLIVIHKGEIIYERYSRGDTVDSLHASFSVAKSFTSALTGIALGEGLIKSIDDPIRKYLPELTSPTFDGVSIKHVLQMSSGIQFSEVYTDPESDINKMTTMVPPLTYLEYINSLGRAHAPGTFNHYASINTQLLGILLVRVSGQSLTDYMTSRFWHPLGMEQKGLWTLDSQGIELAMGGLAASGRDYAKLGLLYLNNGRRGEAQILPKAWVKASVTPTEDHLLPGENKGSSNVSGYQYQWWTPRDWDGDFLARGIWGQNVYIHPGNEVVIVKLAADQKNFDPAYKLAYIDYLQDIAQSLGD
jgi:CubicO group peptidase (beta-lactamase class C family)